MQKHYSSTTRAYIAGFLDGDGSIYVRMKPNKTYRYNYQFAPSVILFQSAKDREGFEKICSQIGLGYIRERKDGVLEYTINRRDHILSFLDLVEPYVVLKSKQVSLMREILMLKETVKTKQDFIKLATLVDRFRELNYSKKRRRHTLTP
jgi:intein-encoded DNA endonuclease-like protein